MLELVVYMIAMAITPGPNTLASLENSSAVGIKKGIFLNYGMLVGVALDATIGFLLLIFIDTISPKINLVLQFLGGVYILYLAIHYLKKADISYSSSVQKSFKTGIFMQLYNFKVMLLCLTAISTYIIPMDKPILLSYGITLLIPICCFLCGLVWAIGGHFISGLYERKGKQIRFLLSLILFVLAIRNFYLLFA